MKYSISSLGSNDPKKRKPLSTTSQQLAQQVAGMTIGQQGVGVQPPAGGQPQLTSPLDTQTGRQSIKTPPRGPLGQGGMGGAGGTQGPGAGAIGGTLNATQFATPIDFEKQRKVQEAKDRAKKEAEEKALINKQEAEQGVDINGDGKIGYQQELGGGREMTNDEVINTALRNLLREQTDVSAEREAMLGEMKAQEAQAIQGLRARAGLGGMGLTGATAGLEAQARTEAGRAQALTTAQFDRAARDEALRRLIQGIELKRGEEVYGLAKDMFEDELGGGDNTDDEPVDGPSIDSSLPAGSTVRGTTVYDKDGNIIKVGYRPPPKDITEAEARQASQQATERGFQAMGAYAQGGFNWESLPQRSQPGEGDRMWDSGVDRNGDPQPSGAIYWDDEKRELYRVGGQSA